MAKKSQTPNKKNPGKTPGKTLVKVQFLRSPTGLLKLGYSAGDIAELSKDQADLLELAKIAKKI